MKRNSPLNENQLFTLKIILVLEVFYMNNILFNFFYKTFILSFLNSVKFIDFNSWSILKNILKITELFSPEDELTALRGGLQRFMANNSTEDENFFVRAVEYLEKV